ncbi:GNAT family N-acetyltransferase [Croceitalea rosinachiae]|uniref:GNAT family N-acetyltransferase n=1 Tax=Croceitalea rosinachiae TaxID=3075596 RepID=A0ABU3ACD7_9FLAO|nr:GNAT family N-acetyltransferase [Croceitalea sp. F388]MDT0607853.1 GNAT family N-acetyltransferase [Croceitalea sp. F388]
MLSFLRLKHNFTLDFFSKGSIYPIYNEVYNKTSGQCFSNKVSVFPNPKNKIYVVNNIPPYFDLKINTEKVPYDYYKTNYLKGFLVNLDGYDSIAEYLKNQLGSKSRSKMRAYLKRLETCFSIRYRMFHGTITKKEYDFLFNQFLIMIKRRFSQRKETHEALKDWEYIRETTYSRIIKKEASLFVIYDGDKPIDICLNYHHQNIFNNSIRSYDIDYNKFRLGHIDILKQLEWCMENEYTVFDLSYGDLDYKRKWCNTVYEFTQHVLFPKDLVQKRVLAFLVIQLINLKAFLKNKKVDILFQKIRAILKRKPVKAIESYEPSLEIIQIPEGLLLEERVKIDINKEEYAFLRKKVYDFQYIERVHSENISVHRPIDRNDTFIVLYDNDGIAIINQKK